MAGEREKKLANLPPPPSSGLTDERAPIGVPRGFSANRSRNVDLDALGRVIIPDGAKLTDPGKQVYRKDARMTATSFPDLGRTVVPDNTMGPINPQTHVYESQAKPQTIGGRTEKLNQTVAAQYFEGMQYAPASWAPEDRARLQRKMIQAGVLPKNYGSFGRWDDQSSAGYEKLMGYANQGGMNVDEVIDQWKQFGGKNDGQPGKVLTVRSPEEIAGVVRQAAGKVLGRSLSAAEVDQLVHGYQNIDRSAQEAAAAAQAGAEEGQDQTVQQPIAIGDYAENQIRQRNDSESKWFTATQRMDEFYSMLGEGGGNG